MKWNTGEGTGIRDRFSHFCVENFPLLVMKKDTIAWMTAVLVSRNLSMDQRVKVAVRTDDTLWCSRDSIALQNQRRSRISGELKGLCIMLSKEPRKNARFRHVK